MDWLNALLAEFGERHWCLTVDIDELFCYPGSEVAPLRALTTFLDRHGYEAAGCLLLDLYPDGSLAACSYKEGDDLLAAAPYFDAGPYERIPVDLCPGFLIRGGMRERIFIEVSHAGPAARIYEGSRPCGACCHGCTKSGGFGQPLRRFSQNCRSSAGIGGPGSEPALGVSEDRGTCDGRAPHFKFLADSMSAQSTAARGEHLTAQPSIGDMLEHSTAH
jgi:hypothetical protein